MLDIAAPLLLPDTRPPLAEGLRLSTWATCPAECVLQYLDPERFSSMDRGYFARGHDIAERFQTMRLDADPLCEYEPELCIPWDHGNSHIDFVVTRARNPEWVGTWELKSRDDKHGEQLFYPKPENLRQVQLMRLCAERAGLKLPEPWRILIFSSSNYAGFGPFTVPPLTLEIRAALEQEAAQINDAMEHLDKLDPENPKGFPECRCNQCFVERNMPKARTSYRWGTAYKAGVIPEEVVQAMHEQGYVQVKEPAHAC